MRFPSKTCRSHYFFCSQHFLPAIFSICISECISSRPIVLKDTHGVQGIKYPLEPCAHTLHAQIHKRASSRRSQHSKHCFLALRVLQWLLHSHIIVRLKMESFFFFFKRSKSMQKNQRYRLISFHPVFVLVETSCPSYNSTAESSSGDSDVF